MRLVSDFALAVTTIRQEAENEPYAAKIAVGEVIRNIAKHENLSVAEVVLHPLWFSGWNAKNGDGTPNLRRTVTVMSDDTDPVVHDCATAWLASETSNLTNGARNYWNPDIVSPSWAVTIKDPIRIGHQLFGTAGQA